MHIHVCHTKQLSTVPMVLVTIIIIGSYVTIMRNPPGAHAFIHRFHRNEHEPRREKKKISDKSLCHFLFFLHVLSIYVNRMYITFFSSLTHFKPQQQQQQHLIINKQQNQKGNNKDSINNLFFYPFYFYIHDVHCYYIL